MRPNSPLHRTSAVPVSGKAPLGRPQLIEIYAPHVSHRIDQKLLRYVRITRVRNRSLLPTRSSSAGDLIAESRPSAAGLQTQKTSITDEGMAPLMPLFHADRSICVRCGRSCSASATKPSAPTGCAPSTASTRFWCSPDRRRRQTFSPRASCAPGGQSHVRWRNRA